MSDNFADSHMKADKRLERTSLDHQKKIIKYKVMNVMNNISKLAEIRNSPDYQYFYDWLKTFHEEHVKSQLKKDLFDPLFWEFNSFENGEPPEDDEDRVVEHIIMLIFKQVYYEIQYPKRFWLTHDAALRHVKRDRLDQIKKLVRNSFFTQLKSDTRLLSEFNELLYRVDLLCLVHVASFEKFFIDWWEFYETLMFVDHATGFVKDELIKTLEKHMIFLPQEIRAQHVIAGTTSMSQHFEEYQAFKGAKQQSHFSTTFKLPLDYSGSIEENINNYLSNLSSFYQEFTNIPGISNAELQKRANDISRLQEEFQRRYYAKIPAIKDKSLCPRVILALYQNYHDINPKKDIRDFFDYMCALLLEGGIDFEDNLGSDAVKKNKYRLRILIKPKKHILYTKSRQSKKDQPLSLRGTNDKMGGDKSNTSNDDKKIEILYKIGADNLRDMLKH
jgi:hypothetical protein